MQPDAQLIFARLEGAWRFERDFAPERLRGVGTARFQRRADAPGLHYREDGALLLPQGAQPFFRHYRYELENDLIAAYFADGPNIGQLFHRLKLICLPDMPGIVEAEATHRCGADDYRSSYRFLGDDRFDLMHRVSGPRKAYVSTTRFTRQP